MRYSANLGFLFSELPLVQAIHAAKENGFDAVECHFPFDTPAEDVRKALQFTDLPMLGLNTWPGDRSTGDFGLAAVSGREIEARAVISQAIDYAVAIKSRAVHVMAGRTDGGLKADAVFCANLTFACDLAKQYGMTVLIEPINLFDVPNYHLSTTAHAERIIDRVGKPNLKILFDCYHLQIMQGNLTRHLKDLTHLIGHIQIAAVPDRSEPDQGEINYPWIIDFVESLGYQGFVGAEYKPKSCTNEGLQWLSVFRSDS